MPWYSDGFEFQEYVSVAERRARARQAAEKLARKQKRTFAPVPAIEGTKMVKTFWGKAWCKNLEAYSDYQSRLPRGRSYARHGAVIDLHITKGKVAALVSGTSIYEVTVSFKFFAPKLWTQLAAECTRQIDSLVDLLRGKLSEEVMQRVTRRPDGLFPGPREIAFKCSCPDWADMCKHVAAVLYGVGVRLEDKPELLFELRGVDHAELVGGAAEAVPRMPAGGKGRKVIKGADLSALFGIEMEGVATSQDVSSADAATANEQPGIQATKRRGREPVTEIRSRRRVRAKRT